MAHHQRPGQHPGQHPSRMRPSMGHQAGGHGMPRNFPDSKYRPQNYDLGPRTLAEASVQDRHNSQLSQNLALLLLDKNFQSVENQAMYALSSLMKDYLLEIGMEIKQTSEIQGRTESTLIDTLNVAYDYGLTQDDLQKHVEESDLSLVPSQMHLKAQKEVLQKRADARMSNIFAMRKSMAPEDDTNLAQSVPQTQDLPLPDYMGRFRTKNSIPDFFRDSTSLPDKLAVADDRTPATKIVNQGYERQKKIEQKRATENAIQKVASIDKSQLEEQKSTGEKGEGAQPPEEQKQEPEQMEVDSHVAVDNRGAAEDVEMQADGVANQQVQKSSEGQAIAAAEPGKAASPVEESKKVVGAPQAAAQQEQAWAFGGQQPVQAGTDAGQPRLIQTGDEPQMRSHKSIFLL